MHYHYANGPSKQIIKIYTGASPESYQEAAERTIALLKDLILTAKQRSQWASDKAK